MPTRILQLSDVRIQGTTLIAAPLWAFGGQADCRRVVDALNHRRRRAHAAAVAENAKRKALFDAGDQTEQFRASLIARHGVFAYDPPKPPRPFSLTWFHREVNTWDREVQICRHCYGEYVRYGRARPRYCSDACALAARKAKRPSRAKVRARVACAYCERVFTQTRADARYCSPSCRVAAHRARVST